MKSLKNKIENKKVFLNLLIKEHEKLLSISNQYPSGDSMRDYYSSFIQRAENRIKIAKGEIEKLQEEEKNRFCPLRNFCKFSKSAVEYRDNSN